MPLSFATFMGNRVNYVMGGVIASLVVVLTLVAIIPAISETPTTSTALNAMGHLTLEIYDPEGNLVGYRQTDNLVTDGALNDLQAGLFSGTLFARADYKFLTVCQGNAVGGGAATAANQNACEGEMTTARIDGSTGSVIIAAAGGDTSDIFKATITLLLTDDNKSFNELALFDKLTVGNLFSVATFTEFLGQTGTVVTAKYTITMSG